MNMTFELFKEAILEVDCDYITRHCAADDATPPYIVWAESMEAESFYGDGGKIYQAIQGTVDLYSKDPDDPLEKEIKSTFNAHEIGFYLNDVLYERDTKLIHHEWVFTIVQEA